MTYFYRPQRSCEGYVFTGVCLSTGEVGVSASVHAGTPPPPEQTPPRSRHTAPEQTPPGADTPPRYGHCCGRYASYWNAFLLIVRVRLEKKTFVCENFYYFVQVQSMQYLSV